MFSLNIGNDTVIIPNRGCRTQEQYNAVKSMLHEVAFSCNNPFEKREEDEEYNCSFVFLYLKHDDKNVHAARITPKGFIKYAT